MIIYMLAGFLVATEAVVTDWEPWTLDPGYDIGISTDSVDKTAAEDSCDSEGATLLPYTTVDYTSSEFSTLVSPHVTSGYFWVKSVEEFGYCKIMNYDVGVTFSITDALCKATSGYFCYRVHSDPATTTEVQTTSTTVTPTTTTGVPTTISTSITTTSSEVPTFTTVTPTSTAVPTIATITTTSKEVTTTATVTPTSTEVPTTTTRTTTSTGVPTTATTTSTEVTTTATITTTSTEVPTTTTATPTSTEVPTTIAVTPTSTEVSTTTTIATTSTEVPTTTTVTSTSTEVPTTVTIATTSIEVPTTTAVTPTSTEVSTTTTISTTSTEVPITTTITTASTEIPTSATITTTSTEVPTTTTVTPTSTEVSTTTTIATTSTEVPTTTTYTPTSTEVPTTTTITTALTEVPTTATITTTSTEVPTTTTITLTSTENPTATTTVTTTNTVTPTTESPLTTSMLVTSTNYNPTDPPTNNTSAQTHGTLPPTTPNQIQVTTGSEPAISGPQTTSEPITDVVELSTYKETAELTSLAASTLPETLGTDYTIPPGDVSQQSSFITTFEHNSSTASLVWMNSILTSTLTADPIREPLPYLVLSWNEWTPWSQCTQLCGGGKNFRLRLCVGDISCPYLLVSRDKMSFSYDTGWADCNQAPCPVDGSWTHWQAWSSCSATCETGTIHRKRACSGPFNGGQDCDGSNMQRDLCEMKECPGKSRAATSDGDMYKEADKRPSAIGVGVISLAFVLFELILILVIDVPTIMRHCRITNCPKKRKSGRVCPRVTSQQSQISDDSGGNLVGYTIQ